MNAFEASLVLLACYLGGSLLGVWFNTPAGLRLREEMARWNWLLIAVYAVVAGWNLALLWVIFS